MIDSHTSVAIAEMVFYVPLVPITILVLIRNWENRPRLAWSPLVTFAILRIAGAAVTIARETQPQSIGLMIAATVLLNIGLIPLLISLIGLIRIILDLSAGPNSRAHGSIKAIRFLFLTAVVLIGVSGGLSGDGPGVLKARVLAQAGYIILTAVLVLATSILLYFKTREHRLVSNGLVFLNISLLSIPFLTIRATYGLLYEFTIQDYSSRWSPLAGSAVAFALMCLLTEYIALCLFIYLGFCRMKQHRDQKRIFNRCDES